jgi:hypothetical protein
MAINEPRKEPPGLGPLNICLKLEIGPTIGQKEDDQLWAKENRANNELK